MTDFNELIPEMRSWNGGDGIDVESWIGCSGNFQHMVGYSVLFWPEFVLHDGMILRKGFNQGSLDGFLAQNGGDKTASEAVMNHLHLLDLLHHGCGDASRERIVYLGNVLKEIYTCKLNSQFPSLPITVDFDDALKDDLVDYQLTFYQVR